MAGEIAKGLDNLSREFYEFVMPPVDVVKEGNELIVTIDLPGFAKNDIDLSVEGNVLSISARRGPQQTSGIVYFLHRPQNIRKDVVLPVAIDEESTRKATYADGVLTLRIAVSTSTQIPIS